MKLKKACIYLISLMCLAVMFTACYYLSYLHALKEFNRNAIERSQEFARLLNYPEPSPSPEAGEDNTLAVDRQASEIILPSTRYIIEICDMKTNTTEIQELNPPGYLVGLTREEVLDYLESYMQDMTLSEHNKGLISYELVKFSEDEVTMRKTYNEDTVPFRFYVVVKDGYVVVYNSDLKSVFDYTGIEAAKLSEKDRIALSKGIYINSKDELYGLLESFTS